MVTPTNLVGHPLQQQVPAFAAVIGTSMPRTRASLTVSARRTSTAFASTFAVGVASVGRLLSRGLLLALGGYRGFPPDRRKNSQTPNVVMKNSLFTFPGIVEHHYNFCAWLLPKISKFQKDQRYLLGARLENASLDMVEYLINASVSEGTTKEEWLIQASQRLETHKI